MQVFKKITSLSATDFISILEKSGLSKRRPIDNRKCIQGMVDNSNLIIGAYENDNLIGISRSVTDFHYCCYLSDLAVDLNYQNIGVGKKLIAETQSHLSETCKIILLSAPLASNYYPKIGFSKHNNAWVLNSTKSNGET